jgi:hypothetical protein
VKTLRLKNIFLANAPLLSISFLLGYSFWYIASYNHIVSLQFTIPLCFSELPDIYTLHAPETIGVTLTAQRSDLYALEKEALAAHININKLLPGKHGIILKEQHLLLPKNIALTRYKPSNLCILISENKKSRATNV